MTLLVLVGRWSLVAIRCVLVVDCCSLFVVGGCSLLVVCRLLLLARDVSCLLYDVACCLVFFDLLC